MESLSKNMSELFPQSKILDPIKNEKILFRNLWEKNEKPLLLIIWLRRFGWSLCRMSALDLSTGLSEASDNIKNKLNHAAIGLAKLDYDEFVKNDYFKNGHVYVDDEKETYKSLNFTKLGFFSMFGLANPKMYKKAYEASSKGITGNLQGEGTQLGGTLIIDKKGNVIFSHNQTNYTDEPNIEEILKCVEKYETPKL